MVTAILNVAKAGAGAGTVSSSSNPASATQIDCGATCSASYQTGTVVTLTAMAAAGSLHSGWTGCDTVSGPTCTVTMNGARTVTATFALQRFTLTVSKSSPLGIGDGTVTSSSRQRHPQPTSTAVHAAILAKPWPQHNLQRSGLCCEAELVAFIRSRTK
jgi:hypothetical protein